MPQEYRASRPHREEAEEYRWLFMSGSEDRTGSEQRNLFQKVRALRPLGLLCDFPRNAASLSLERHLGELGYTTVRCSVNCAQVGDGTARRREVVLAVPTDPERQ